LRILLRSSSSQANLPVLQRNNNDIGVVVSEYFDGNREQVLFLLSWETDHILKESQLEKKYGWDETAFGADREGNSNAAGIGTLIWELPELVQSANFGI
jgi:hypothetical protein